MSRYRFDRVRASGRGIVVASPTPTPSPSPSPTPSPTPSAVTHNNTTPSDLPYTVTNWSELQAAVNDRLNGINAGVPIVLRGPTAGSTAGAYDGPGGIMELNPSSLTLGADVTIRSAKIGTDKAIWRGPASTSAPPAAQTGWINVPGRSTVQGVEIRDRNGSAAATANSYVFSYYTVGRITIDRCLGTGIKNASGGFGCGGNTRFFRAAGIPFITISNNVFDGLACILYMDGGATDLVTENNSVLEWSEHAWKIGGSVARWRSQNNLLQAPKPGYDGEPADPYNNHGNVAYIGGTGTTSLDTISLIDEFLCSLTDQSHSAYLRMEPSVGPSFASTDRIKIQGTKIRGGLPTTISLNAVNGTGNEISGISIRKVTGSTEVPTIQTILGNSTLAYFNNDGQYQNNSSTLSGLTGLSNTGGSIANSAANLLAEMEVWAAGGNPAGITMQTLSTLGLA
jgi:hypothetical protein